MLRRILGSSDRVLDAMARIEEGSAKRHAEVMERIDKLQTDLHGTQLKVATIDGRTEQRPIVVDARSSTQIQGEVRGGVKVADTIQEGK